MVDPIKLARQEEPSLEEIVSASTNELQQADGLPNLFDKLTYLEGVLQRVNSARVRFTQDRALVQIEQDVKDRVFNLRNAEGLLDRIEDRLGQGGAEPVDLTLQQTLEVVQQLRRLSETIPNDERLATVSTNLCEGLESFVSTVLTEPMVDGEGSMPTIGANPGDLTMALEVINAIQACPGADRTPSYKTLRQQFIDAACHSAWSRIDRLFDTQLERATKKEYLHEALTIWSLLPDLSENAGSPRLSQLPDDILRTVHQASLREVIGSSEVGDRQGLLDTALFAKELGEDYLTMVPAISVSDAQEALGGQVAETLIRRIGTELSKVSSSQELEQCLSVLSVLRTIPGIQADERLQKLPRGITLASWRIRRVTLARLVRRAAVPSFMGLLGGMGLATGYIGLAVLISHFYDFDLPLAP